MANESVSPEAVLLNVLIAKPSEPLPEEGSHEVEPALESEEGAQEGGHTPIARPRGRQQETLFDIMAEAQNDLLRNVGGLDKIAAMVERQVDPAQPDEATSVASELRDLAQSSRATAREDLEEISKLRPAPVSAENAIAPEAAEEMAVETAVVAPKKPRTPRKTATTKKSKPAKAPDLDDVTKPTRTRRATPRVSP